LQITRREFSLGAAALALAGTGFTLSDLIGPALAQDVPPADLMQPGALGDMAIGDEKAPVTIIEYASMTCPHCAHFAEATYPDLKKRYIDTGKVRFIFREFPLDQLAAAGFMLARCASQSGVKAPGPTVAAAGGPSEKYFAMVETLFAKQREWVVQKPLQPLFNIAKQAGFSEQSFNECLKNQQVLDGIEEVRQKAVKTFKVQSTPTFFINGKRVAGAMSIEDLEKELTPFLKS
jgi:protein-disulfide isomerase